MADQKAQALEWKAKGNEFLKAKDFAQAIDAYTKAIELDATNHVFFSNRSAAYLSQGEADKALADGEACIKVNPTWAKGYSRKGAALQSLKRFDEAIATFNEGLKVDASSAMLKAGLEAATTAKQKSEAEASNPFGPNLVARLAMNPKFRGYMEDPSYMAKLQMLQTNPQAALATMQSDPRMMETLSFVLGIDLSGAGGPGGPGGPGSAPTEAASASAPAPAAASAPEPAQEPAPEEVELTEEEKAEREKKQKAIAKKNEGNEFYKQKNFEEALRCYDEAYELDNENVLILNNKAAVYFAQKDYAKCIETCNGAIERGRELFTDFSTMAKIFARIGNAEVKRGNLAAAIENYDKSLMEHHSNDVYNRRRKIVALKKKKDEEAYWDDDKAEEAKARGNAFFKEGKWPDAIKEYEEATKRNPRNPIYWQNMASARMKVMDYNRALSDAERAIKVDPAYVKGYYRKGLVQTAMKEYHKAISTFEAGLKVDPESVECKSGMQETIRRINQASQSGEVDKERAARAMADPEIQAILRDPIVQQTLQDCQTDPRKLQAALMDPSMGPKIMKLRSAGVLQMR